MAEKSLSIHDEEGRRTRTFYINEIFEKDSLRILYTKTADLYQDIMKFNLQNGSGVPFTLNNLAKWLIKKNLDFVVYYSGSRANISISNRIANRRDSIQKCIDDLVSCGLISVEGKKKAEKNDFLTQSYKFTAAGNIISMLLELPRFTEDSDVDKLINNIFSLIGAYVSNRGSYLARFLSELYLKSAKIEECSDAIIWHLRYQLHSHDVGYKYQNLDEFLYWTLYFMIYYRESSPLFLEHVFKKTLFELDEEAKSIILLHEKVQVENQIRQMSPPKEWEKMWFHNINDHTKLVLYGRCTKCSEAYPFVVPLMEYFGMFTDEKTYMKCIQCNSDDSLCIILSKPFQYLPEPGEKRRNIRSRDDA